MNVVAGAFLLLLLSLSSLHCEGIPVSLWPQPTTSSFGSSSSLLDQSTFKITTTGSPSAILSRAIPRYLETIFSAALFDPTAPTSSSSNLESLEVILLTSDENLRFGIDESYNLTISGTKATLTAQNVFGALWGFETFTQLVVKTQRSENAQFVIQGIPISILDKPRFGWRGILIDTSRHYFPVPFLLHTIDALAANKMNVFHWHVIDADSFPIVSEVYPELSGKGAYASNAIYSRPDVQKIIDYALDRGVRVVIEFDIPGHSAFGRAFPDIVGCPSFYDDPYIYEKQSVALDPTLDKTYEILGNLLREFDKVFPDLYMHLGGDEVRYKCWQQKPSIKQFMDANGIADYDDLERYFWERLGKEVLPTLSKTIVLWDDGFVNGVPIPSNALIHVWQQERFLVDAVKAGRQVVRSNGWYLDQAVPGGTRYRWLETWIDFYILEPVPQGLSEQEASLVIGGQACMWTEQVDSHTFDALVWPRASATAERLWSKKEVNNSTEAGYRLMDHRCRLHLRNVDASPIFPDYCERVSEATEAEGDQQNEFESTSIKQTHPKESLNVLGQPFEYSVVMAFFCGSGVMLAAFIFARFFKSFLSSTKSKLPK